MSNPSTNSDNSMNSSRRLEVLKRIESEFMEWRESHMDLFDLAKLPDACWDTLDHWRDFLQNGSVVFDLADPVEYSIEGQSIVSQEALYALADDSLADVDKRNYVVWVKLRRLLRKDEEEFAEYLRIWRYASSRLLVGTEEWWSELREQYEADPEGFLVWSVIYYFVLYGLLGRLPINMYSKGDYQLAWSLVRSLEDLEQGCSFGSEDYDWGEARVRIGQILSERGVAVDRLRQKD